MPRAVRGRLLSVLVLALQALTVMAMDNTCSEPQECEKRCNQVAYWQGEVKLQLTTMCFENQCFKGLRDERCAGVTNGERFSPDVTNVKGKDGKHWLQQKDWWLLPIKRIQYDLSFSSLLTDILLHGGQPCNKRYCTCMYFSNTDKSYYYKSLCDFI